MIKTTVVIPNYNGGEYLKKCIESLLASTVDVNIILVDNASTDGSLQMVKSTFSSVHIVELKNNTGFCYACNTGIKLSTTPYVFLFNNDAYVRPDTIEKLEKNLDTDDKVFSVQAKMLQMFNEDLVDSAGDEYCALGWAYSLGKDKSTDNYKGLKRVFSACGGASLYRKSYLDIVGLLDENHFAYLEDVDLGYRANIYGYKNLVNMDALVYHAGSKTSGSRHNDFKVSLSSKNSIYIVYKNMPLLQFLINLPLLIIGFIIKAAFFIKKGLGKTYITGLFKGVMLCLSKEGRKNKVRFKMSRLSTYIALEVVLLVNCIKRFIG